MQYVRDALALLGTGLLAYGAHEVYPPAGFMVGGVVLLVVSVVGTLRAGAR